MGELNRREFIGTVAGGVAAAAVPGTARGGGAAEADAAPSRAAPALQTTPSNPSMTGMLADPAFRPLPLGAIRATGWLQRQLRIQADGLSGHLDEFWPDVANSQWFGGQAEGWERAPYWLDGAIPLAWILGDAPLEARITKYVEHIVAHQRPDGWYAPYPEDAVAKRYDMWAILLANKALVQYHEATGDRRVLDAVTRSLHALHAGLERTPLYDWGRFRWFEGLVPVFYVYERTQEQWLLELAGKLREQGVDYQTLYRTPDMTVPTPRRGLWKWTKHVVNTSMATKAAALSWRLDQRAADRAFGRAMIEFLDRWHGQVTGMFTGDECLAGRNPLQGTELCAVVEFMYSLEHLYATFGDPWFADRLERIAFNALPATFSPDMWAHQYDQQVNQVQCTINPEHLFSSNGPESNLYGLEPNFGCCTSNMHQGWPKFAAHLWLKTPDEGIVAAAYAPSVAEFRSGSTPVTVTLDTDYPFRETLSITVEPRASVRFPLLLRVPAWAAGATVRVAGGAETPMQPGTLHRIERTWEGEVTVDVRFPMRPAVLRGYNESVAIERGPLVYSLAIGEQWTRVNADKPHREPPHADYQVTPTTPWNCALVVNEQAPEQSLRFEERPVGERPFSPEGAGMVCTAKGRRLPAWRLRNGWAGEISAADLAWTNRPAAALEPLEDVRLIPYGCTNIRITEFPQSG
jgi:hypothetical protein